MNVHISVSSAASTLLTVTRLVLMLNKIWIQSSMMSSPSTWTLRFILRMSWVCPDATLTTREWATSLLRVLLTPDLSRWIHFSATNPVSLLNIKCLRDLNWREKQLRTLKMETFIWIIILITDQWTRWVLTFFSSKTRSSWFIRSLLPALLSHPRGSTSPPELHLAPPVTRAPPLDTSVFPSRGWEALHSVTTSAPETRISAAGEFENFGTFPLT